MSETENPTASAETAEAAAAAEVKPSNRLTIDVEIPTDDGGVETKTLHFKPLTVVPLGIVRKTRNNQQEQMFAIFEWAISPEDLDEVLDKLPADKLQETLEQMQKASGVEVGES